MPINREGTRLLFIGTEEGVQHANTFLPETRILPVSERIKKTGKMPVLRLGMQRQDCSCYAYYIVAPTILSEFYRVGTTSDYYVKMLYSLMLVPTPQLTIHRPQTRSYFSTQTVFYLHDFQASVYPTKRDPWHPAVWSQEYCVM